MKIELKEPLESEDQTAVLAEFIKTHRGIELKLKLTAWLEEDYQVTRYLSGDDLKRFVRFVNRWPTVEQWDQRERLKEKIESLRAKGQKVESPIADVEDPDAFEGEIVFSDYMPLKTTSVLSTDPPTPEQIRRSEERARERELRRFAPVTAWAVLVEDTYEILGRGRVNCGRLLYGEPKVDDSISWYGCDSLDRLRGVEYSRLYSGANVGILMDQQVSPGTCLFGATK